MKFSVLRLSLCLTLLLPLINFGCSKKAIDTPDKDETLLVLSPDTVVRVIQYGDAFISSPYITVRSAGAGEIGYSAYSTSSWIEIPIDTGQTPDSFFTKISASGLADGRYLDSVVVTSPFADNSPQYVLFDLTVVASIIVTPPLTTLWKSQADTLEEVQIVITSGGGSEFDFTAFENSEIFDISITSGTTPDTITLTFVDGLSLEVGSYRDSVILYSAAINDTTIAYLDINISTWSQQYAPSGLSHDIKSVSFVDENNGWAVLIVGGSATDEALGRVIRTDNGGVSWSEVMQTSNGNPSVAAGLGGIDFVDTEYGWAVGHSAGIYFSAESGSPNSWLKQNSGLDTLYSLQDVDFIDRDAGWAVGKHGTVLRTVNGGNNWVSQLSGTTHDLSEVLFFNSSLGWVVGNGGTILRTTNGGGNWIHSVLPGSLSSIDLRAVSFPTVDTGWVVGKFGLIARSTDGGLSWTQQESNSNNFLSAVEFVNSDRGWALGNLSTILFTDDGGDTWVDQSFTTDNSFWFHSIDFVNSGKGWIVGDEGVIFQGRFGTK